MSDSVVEIDKLTDEAKNKLRDFDELEAYFLLCEIFSNAQTTKDYARFQSDLAEWKKRYPIDLFSDELKRKIKYMLSKEFIETVLKDFAVFEALSKKDPAKGLETVSYTHLCDVVVSTKTASIPVSNVSSISFCPFSFSSIHAIPVIVFKVFSTFVISFSLEISSFFSPWILVTILFVVVSFILSPIIFA